MKLRIKRVNEDTPTSTPQQNITDPSLLSQAQQLQNDKQKIQDTFNKAQTIFNKAQEEYNKQMKIVNDKLAQLMKKQESISNNNSNTQPVTQQTESVKFNKVKNILFESTSKKNLLVDAINIAFDNIKEEDFSYNLSSDEIRKMARKINDYLTENKNEDIIWEDVRYVIKNYIIKHNTISLSHSEINIFNDELEEVLSTNEEFEKEFGKYFK